MAFMLRARITMAEDVQKEKAFVREFLARYNTSIKQSPWQGLAELQNEGGKECPESCPTQAWSMACMLEALKDCE